MNLKNVFSKSPQIVLAIGFVTGALAMISIMSPGVLSTAIAGPEGKTRPVGNISATDMSTLRSLNSSFEGLAEYVAPAVVHIKAQSGKSTDVMGRPMLVGGQGSGVIFRPDGYIVTNDHVVGGFDKVTVILNDGREFPGKVTRGQESDIAIVKIDAKDLPTAPFGDSNRVKPGQFAVAVGSPFGLENSVTIGHVSALQRQSAINDSRLGNVRSYPDLIQTDAAINQGNSGGPLLNVDGEVIGINTAIYSESGGSMGIGFAIPSNQARLIAEMLIEKGKITRAFMGVLTENLKPYQKKEMNLSGGALLKQVNSDSPAAMGGLKEGDIVVRIGTYPVASQLDLRNVMLRYGPGKTVEVEYIRDGQKGTAKVKLAAPPATPVAQAPREIPLSPDKIPFDLEDPRIDKLFKDRFGVPPIERPAPRAPSGRPVLGVQVDSLNANLRKQFSIPADASGAVVTLVEPGSLAERAGIEIGDVISKLGETSVKSADDLVKAMQGVKSGDTKQIQVTRYGKNAVMSQSRSVTF